MKEVDSQALEFVGKSLRLAGRSTGATDFDDEHLQQVLDVGPMVPGVGLFDGWCTHTVQHTHTGTGTLFRTEDPYETLETLGGSRNNDRVWIVACQLKSFNANDEQPDEVRAGYQLPELPDISIPRNIGVARSVVFGGQLVAGTSLLGLHSTGSDYTIQQNLPMMIPPGGLLLLASTVTFVATNFIIGAEYILWCGPRGMRPPVMMGGF